MTDDEQLLRQYTREHSEAAFGELVKRHIDLVYSAALRVSGGDSALAQDVTQTVFIDLARKAWSLPRNVMLAGWLYRHTCYKTSTAIRTEQRRRIREQTAMEIRALDDQSELPWENLAPHLDDGLNQLSASDRNAIVLRFLQRQDLRAVGVALGITEDAAQKRVTRALEKLRGVLTQRGVVLTAAALASTLAAKSVTAAPVGLAVSTTAAALTASAGAGTVLTLLKIMATTKLQTSVIGAIIVASLVAPFVIQHQAQARLNQQDEASWQQTDNLAQLRAENARLSNLVAGAESSPIVPNPQRDEVLKLRSEISRLSAEVTELSAVKTNTPLSHDEALASMRQMFQNRVSRLKQMFADDPTQAVPEMRYLTDADWLNLVEYDHHLIDPDNANALASVRGKAQINFAEMALSQALWQYGKINGGQFPTDLSQLTPYFKIPVDASVLQDWTILPVSSLPNSMRINEDHVITQKSPVDPNADQRIAIGMKQTHLGRSGTNDWIGN